MKKLNKDDLNPEIFKLYDAYAHNQLGRRQFIEKLSIYAVGGITIPSILSCVMPDYKNTTTVDPNDEEIISDHTHYDSPNGGGMIRGLLSMPAKEEGMFPGVVVVHENRGLNPYIEDVGRRLAKEGFISLAPDALTPLGGYPGNDDDGRAMQKQRDRNEMLEDFKAAFDYLMAHDQCTGKVGVVGFCFGGGISNLMAVHLPELAAAVPFYGSPHPTAEEVALIEAPLLIQLAELDERVNKGWPAYEEALKANNKKFTAHIYENANHGFHNNTTPRYDEAAATLAWERTIEFFKKELR